MIPKTSVVLLNAITVQDVLNWLLPALGVVVAGLLIWFVWRYIRSSNQAGRSSEFNERTFKKLIEDRGSQEQLPFCKDCKMPMRMEIKYKDFMKDQGDFLISRETAEPTLLSLVKGKRISEEDKENIFLFFEQNPEVKEQLFRRYKCPNCSKVVVLPYQTTIK